MNKQIEMLCGLGSLTFGRDEEHITLVFEPYSRDPNRALQSTVLIKRDSPGTAIDALIQYINNGKHWSEYPRTFFEPDHIENDHKTPVPGTK